MSDQNKFVNTYIDTIIATVHEQTNSLLQLKAQTKVLGDLLLEKDQVILSLTQQLENSNTDASELVALRNECASLRTKASHIDTFASQVAQMKNIILQKDKEIEALTFPKKQINSKNKVASTPATITANNRIDDF